MKRRLFLTGTAAAGALTVGSLGASSASADSATGAFAIARFDRSSGRWPERPAPGGVVWMDESGAAPKPPLVAGDAFLQAGGPAGQASSASGELLLPQMQSFASQWQARGGATLAPSSATISARGDGLVLADVPVIAGREIAFSVVCLTGSVVATIEFWNKSQEIRNVATKGEAGTVKLTTTVPAGVSVANLWLEFGKAPSSFSSASLVQAS